MSNSLAVAPFLVAASALAWFVPSSSVPPESSAPPSVEVHASDALAVPPPSISSSAVVQRLISALPNWAFVITSISATDAGVVTAAQEQRWIDIVLNQTVYPCLDDSDRSTLKVLKLAQDATIKPAEIAAYRAYLDSVIKPGDVIVRATWTSVTAGTFDTFAVCSGANVLYEPFLQLVPSDWPFSTPLFASTTVTCHWPASGGTWSFANGFGATACSFSIDATAHCNGSELIGCNPPDFEASGKAFTWTANASATSTAIGNCCVTNVVFGYASGFKKVKVGGSGGGVSGSVEIEGSIGCGGTFARSATACCD